MTKAASSALVLGWKVNRGLDPDYWLRPTAKIGAHAAPDLVGVPAETTGNHAAIVAQSGAGKSFLLGRLVEEILVKTKARCLILDPNGDFLQVSELAASDLWKKFGYDPNRRKGFLPTELRAQFEKSWNHMTVRVRSVYAAHAVDVEPFELPWASLPPEFLTIDLDPILSSEVHHCHRFVQAVAELAAGKVLSGDTPLNLLEEAEHLLDRQRQMDTEIEVQREILVGQYKTRDLVTHRVKLRLAPFEKRDADKEFLEEVVYRPFEEETINRAIERCLTLPRYVSKDAARIYFGRARRYEEGKIFSAMMEQQERAVSELARLEVVDLASIKQPEMRRLAVSSLIATEFDRLREAWHNAVSGEADDDMRSPTFLVLDEAHNLIPGGEVGRSEAALREQFRQIAAEGRKYGFFLLLVTQRPDKLDNLVVSECENRIVMKLSSQSVLDTTKEMLGLEDVPQKMLEKSLEFDVGRALIYGQWAPEGPTIFYCAARRTKEGGRNLRPDYWAVP